MLIDLINRYSNLAISTYHVDPRIFIALIILSLPPFYWSLYIIGKEVSKKLKKEKLNQKRLSTAIMINLISYIVPYIYVVLFGKNLPWWFWIFFAAIVAFTIYSFINRTIKPIQQSKK